MMSVSLPPISIVPPFVEREPLLWRRLHFLSPETQFQLQGDSGGLGLGYVDINSVSLGGYPETELSQHNPVREQMGHPIFPLAAAACNE